MVRAIALTWSKRTLPKKRYLASESNPTILIPHCLVWLRPRPRSCARPMTGRLPSGLLNKKDDFHGSREIRVSHR